MVGASVAMRPMIGEITLRNRGGNTVKDVAKTVGIIAPPKKPCNARHTIISPMDDDNAHIKLIKVKAAAEATNSQRVEKIRVSVPDSGIITTSATR